MTKPVYRGGGCAASGHAGRRDINILASMASQFGALGNLAGLDMGGGMEKERAMAMLRSRALSEKFIKENQLLPRIFADHWDARSAEVEGSS